MPVYPELECSTKDMPFMQIGDNLHEVFKVYFLGKITKKKKNLKISSADIFTMHINC